MTRDPILDLPRVLSHDMTPVVEAPSAPRRGDRATTAVVVALAALLWAPRASGPLDLRWDGAVYYILGTSLANGTGYRLLNEPGRIEAVQYPPLLPAIVAAHQAVLGTDDPARVGRALRVSAFVLFLAYAAMVARFLLWYLSPRQALVGALLTLFCLHTWFLSDLLFPEVAFATATLVFLFFAGRTEARRDAVLAYVSAVASYALRTVGLVALAVWVLDAALRRRFRQAVVRAALAAMPVIAWQAYVLSVEHSASYQHPAYAYQRAPYMVYNVSYARNIRLRDPFTPEKGSVNPVRRVARNALDLPASLGETLGVSRRYLEMGLHAAFGEGGTTNRIIDWSAFLALATIGVVLVCGGLVALAWRRLALVPAYVVLYLGALCLTPFPGQYQRYLMPIAALLALCALASLRLLDHESVSRSRLVRVVRGRGPRVVLAVCVAAQVAVAGWVYAREYRPVSYVDANGRRLSYRLFFYDDSQREFDEAVGYVQSHARFDDVVAAGTPHWIYLRTKLQAVMPPFEKDVDTAERLLDSVPVRYLLVGADVVASERYTRPVVQRFSDRWTLVYTSSAGGWHVYRRSSQ